MSLTDYLAKNYLTADSKPEKKSKKRKREAQEIAGLSIADDDVSGFEKPAPTSHIRKVTCKCCRVLAAVHSLTVLTAAREAPKSQWKVVGAAPPSDADQRAADAIIAQAEAENQARVAEDEDAPQAVGMDDEDDDGPRMASGVKAGLQSGAQVTATIKKRQDSERKRLEKGLKDSDSKMGETIYRDATGRIVNAKLMRAEALQEKANKAREQQEREKAVGGDIQKREADARKAQLGDAKYMDVARYADDKELNDELKAQDRWNDPAAGFVTKKEETKSVSGKKLYKGGFEPNRYGIRPGHRWDGVDRSNAFERKWFAARNNRDSRRNLEYAWQMDE